MDLEDRQIGHVTVLFGARGGRYPQGNSLLVRGREETVLIDPSLGVIPRGPDLPPVDRVLLSHCHEDHLAGAYLFPDVPCHLHEEDRPGIVSLEGMLGIYGFPEPIRTAWARALRDSFHFGPRPDARPFRDGDVFDLGGGVRIEAVHAPGHTRGHCFFRIEPDGVLFLADVDLSSFGPYYGDAWSDLESFERTLARARDLRARWYVTFHHVGILEGSRPFHDRLERYGAVIASRESRLLEYLVHPRTLDEVVEHRFVYRPTDDVPFADPIERRSMSQHLVRLLESGRVEEVEPERFRAYPARSARGASPP